MATTTIRVPVDVRDRLAELAASEGKSTSEVVRKLLAEYERREFFRKLGEDFTRLRADKEAWADYQSEIALWDSTLMDGLEDEPPWEDE